MHLKSAPEINSNVIFSNVRDAYNFTRFGRQKTAGILGAGVSAIGAGHPVFLGGSYTDRYD